MKKWLPLPPKPQNSAMGGGKDPLKLDDALASVDDFVAVKLGL